MIYSVYNGAIPSTASPVKVATGAAIKTLLQFNPIIPCKIIEWGASFDGSAAATPGVVELIQTSVAATVTAFVAADITQMDASARQFGSPTTNLITVGTAASGYTASAEGSITTLLNLDQPQLIAPTNQFIKQFPLGREPFVAAGQFVRVRVNFPATVNALCYLVVEF